MFSVAPVAPRLWWHDIYIVLKQQTHNKYNIYFLSKKGFQATSRFQYNLVSCNKVSWSLAHYVGTVCIYIFQQKIISSDRLVVDVPGHLS